MEVVVGRIGRPHGVRGDVNVEPRTDDPDRRFSPGTALVTDRADRQSLVVDGYRWHSGRLLLHFEGVTDRSAVESLRGVLLSTEVDPDESPDDPDEYYDHQLIGLTMVDRNGATVGTVNAVIHGAQDLLVVTRPGAGDAMVPFVRALVPEVDVAGGRLTVDLPDGLLDLTAE
jgi:16S rRNA processing protein RimM